MAERYTCPAVSTYPIGPANFDATSFAPASVDAVAEQVAAEKARLTRTMLWDRRCRSTYSAFCRTGTLARPRCAASVGFERARVVCRDVIKVVVTIRDIDRVQVGVVIEKG
jgi:hypothetical protein